tara:strand:+ start:476 stop:736 length:261 start_codon:yes stop_codon:yes gene_type:complete
MEIGKKVNVGNSSYGMKNVVMELVERIEHRCKESECENHKAEECLDCHDIDTWDCSGCNDDDATVFHHKVGYNYSPKCDGCGGGWN